MILYPRGLMIHPGDYYTPALSRADPPGYEEARRLLCQHISYSHPNPRGLMIHPGDYYTPALSRADPPGYEEARRGMKPGIYPRRAEEIKG